MKQKNLLLFAVFAMAISASAYDFEVDGIYYNVISMQDLTCEVTYNDGKYNSYSGDIVIPQSVTYRERTYSVTRIRDEAFRNSSSLTSVVIPNSVTVIGQQAFFYCSSLTSVVIGNSVTEIRDLAFYNCSSLTSVVIPNSVTSIEGSAFKNTNVTDYICDNEKYVDYFYCVKNLTLGENVKKNIGGLSGLDDLEKITIKNENPPTFSNSTPFTNKQYMNLNIYVPADAIEKYKTADVWKDFWNINTIESDEGSGSEPESTVCAAPTIELVDGKLVATSATEGATCYTSIKTDDYKGVTGNDPIELTGVYNISSYAFATGYQNSETVTATLVWVNPTLEGSSDVISMEARKAVLIRTQDGGIVVSGTERGEGIQLYSIDGRQLRSVSAEDGQTVIPCSTGKGEVVIVKIGQKTVKVTM